MSQPRTGELEDYIKRLGEHMNIMYSKINEMNKRIKESEDVIAQLRTNLENNTEIISNLKENNVSKVEFDEFVSRLTESLRDLLPPLPVGEANKEGQ